MPSTETITYAPVAPSDLEALVAVRIAAMRESLERIGRFDPSRSRARLAEGFDPVRTWWILVEDERVGFYAFGPADGGFSLDHLYVLPEAQGRGVGGSTLDRLIGQAAGSPIHVTALRDSPANRFYAAHGFRPVGEGEWDVHYVRP